MPLIKKIVTLLVSVALFVCKIYLESVSSMTDTINIIRVWSEEEVIQDPDITLQILILCICHLQENKSYFNSSMTYCIICISRVPTTQNVKVLKLFPVHFQQRSEIFWKKKFFTRSLLQYCQWKNYYLCRFYINL